MLPYFAWRGGHHSKKLVAILDLGKFSCVQESIAICASGLSVSVLFTEVSVFNFAFNFLLQLSTSQLDLHLDFQLDLTPISSFDFYISLQRPSSINLVISREK